MPNRLIGLVSAMVLASTMATAACSSDNGEGGGSCSGMTPCGGDVVGTWNVTSSCLKVSGQIDMTMFGLGCTDGSVTGSLQVTGTWTAKSDGTYSDNTTTSGNEQLALPASCLKVSGTTTTCDNIGGVVGALGYTSASCTNAASGGGCTCSGTVNQTGGMGLVSSNPGSGGNYTTSANVVTVDSSSDYSYCVSGSTLTVTPQSSPVVTTGTIVFQKQ